MAKVFKSTFADIAIPAVTLTDFLMPRVRSFGNRVALIDDKQQLTFAQFAAAAESLAHSLVNTYGLVQGDVVAIFSSNSVFYPVIFHAILRAGGIVSTINPAYTTREVEEQLRDCAARFVFAIAELADHVRQAAAHTGKRLDKVFVIGDSEFLGCLQGKANSPAIVLKKKINADDVAVLPYSSGTTGLSKGVCLSHYNIVANILQLHAVETDVTGDSVLVAVLPFFHIYGMVVIMHSALFLGAKLVVMPRFDLEVFLSHVQTHRISHAHIVPPIALALAKSPVVDRFDVSSIRVAFSGAAPLGEELQLELKRRLKGAVVKQGYGMTEMSPVSHLSPTTNVRMGSCGMLVPNATARIVNLEGKDVAVGEEGELWVKGPMVMKGYLNNKKATDETIDADGWLHTGDVARVDADGHFFIVDRLKELIKVKGFQVPPAELEALLVAHPAVADCAVIGIPDVAAGEAVKAFVVRKADVRVTEQQLMDYVAKTVVHYKKVTSVEFIDVIPKSGSGKILRRQLRDREKAKPAAAAKL